MAMVTASTVAVVVIAWTKAIFAKSSSLLPADPSVSAIERARASDSAAWPRMAWGKSARFGVITRAYWAARTEPAMAMPMAAPTSRPASLIAEATPCFSSGTAAVIAEVAGAVHTPTPLDITSMGHNRSQ
ncbi:hypothetical protein [Mycolicibacter kumamotonensis]|uniref:hypothetical protein n=1 Tax=Mycolicibacter kumamotonensis TaxID=354243 RepID=UPI001F2DC855|nr:hypothetical protein [Mycolicibacter kumamotonensis]